MLLIEAMPLVVELGVLLDLFVGIFVACIIINHINQAFSSMIHASWFFEGIIHGLGNDLFSVDLWRP
jgi:hypothetical protein